MRFILFMLMCFSLTQALGKGKIVGKVTDEKNGETVIGAIVVVQGSSAGAATDIDGNFSVSVDAGVYSIEVKYVGYQTKQIDNITVGEGGEATVNVLLAVAKANQLKEVVVQSSMKKENVGALYAMQKNSAVISDGISADMIKRSPDRSTGEALKRVSGTTVQDNKFVIVRGLSDRYNTAIVDNAVLPSTEPNRKAFSFDIIPSPS